MLNTLKKLRLHIVYKFFLMMWLAPAIWLKSAGLKVALPRECAFSGQQTSVTTGTFMHRDRLPMRSWFVAMQIVSTNLNRISVL